MKKPNPVWPMTDQMREIMFINGRIDWVNMSDVSLQQWEIWSRDRNEQAYDDARRRANFRVNQANMRAEIDWRNKEIPF